VSDKACKTNSSDNGGDVKPDSSIEGIEDSSPEERAEQESNEETEADGQETEQVLLADSLQDHRDCKDCAGQSEKVEQGGGDQQKQAFEGEADGNRGGQVHHPSTDCQERVGENDENDADEHHDDGVVGLKKALNDSHNLVVDDQAGNGGASRHVLDDDLGVAEVSSFVKGKDFGRGRRVFAHDFDGPGIGPSLVRNAHVG